MLSLQSDIPGGGDHLIIVLRQKVLKVLVNDLLVDLIDQCLCWDNQGEVHFYPMLYLVLDVHSHEEGLIILDVGGFPYFAFSQAQPFVTVKSKAMSCAGLRCRFACKQSRLVFCDFFLCLLVGFTVTKAVLDFAGQFIALDIPSLPPSVLSLENAFTLLHRLKPPIFIVRSDTIYFSK